jgi:hypothetical protein
VNLEQWLERVCPAFRSLSTDQRGRLLAEALAEEQEHVRRLRRQHWSGMGLFAVDGVAASLVLGAPLLDPLVLIFALIGGLAFSRVRVASRIELHVRELARHKAQRLSHAVGGH